MPVHVLAVFVVLALGSASSAIPRVAPRPRPRPARERVR